MRPVHEFLWMMVACLGLTCLYLAGFYFNVLSNPSELSTRAYAASAAEIQRAFKSGTDGKRYILLYHGHGVAPDAPSTISTAIQVEGQKGKSPKLLKKMPEIRLETRAQKHSGTVASLDAVEEILLTPEADSSLVEQSSKPQSTSAVANPEYEQSLSSSDDEEANIQELFKARKPRIDLNETDFTAFNTVFEYFTRNSLYAPVEITAKDLRSRGIGPKIFFFRVVANAVPVYRRIVSPIRLAPKNMSSLMVRVVERGHFVIGTGTLAGKNSMWLKVGKDEFLPIFGRVYARPGITILLKQETRLSTLKELTTKPFEEKSRECSLIREYAIKSACYKRAHVLRETRRLLKSYDLLRIKSTNTSLVDDPPETMSFDEGMRLLFRPMSEIEICNSCEWTQCTLHSFCTWTYTEEIDTYECIHNSMQRRSKFLGVFAPEYDTYQKDFDYKHNLDDGKKYFIYQPSGGINNQRIQLEIALTICILANRTCIVPHAAQHTNYFFRYNLHSADRMMSMQRIFDFEELRKVVDVVTIPEHLSLVEWIEEIGGTPYVQSSTGLKNDPEENGGWRVIMRDARRMLNKYIWREADIKRFRTDESRYLFFANHTMWGTIDLFIWSSAFKSVRNSLTFTKPFKRMAMSLIEDLGEYNSIHVRRGDKKREVGFLDVVRDASVYGERMKPYMAQTPALYVATDEQNLSYFDPLKEQGYNLIFWKNLNQEKLMPFIRQFPPQMFKDALGIVEQLICTYSNRFLGSPYSTFTMFILRMRYFYPFIAIYNETQPDGSTLSVQPKIYKDLDLSEYSSGCNPFRPFNHKTPC